MNKQEVLERLCKLTTKVAQEEFSWSCAADCFCGDNNIADRFNDYRFDEDVMEFIEEAVEEKLLKQKEGS